MNWIQNKGFKVGIVLLVLYTGFGCGTSKKPYIKKGVMDNLSLPNQELVHTAFLIGDAGGLDDYEKEENIVFEAVEQMIASEGKNQSLIYLGDNIYPQGLDRKKAADRPRQEQILDAHLDLAASHKGETYFIPGNHDWNDARPGGRKATRRQYKYVQENRANERIHFYPEKACGDPEVVKINKDLAFLFVDSQWWLHNWKEEKGMNRGCEIKSRRAFADAINDIFLEHKNDQIVIFLHHPFESNGTHGGKFPLKTHLLPIPILGSLQPVLRNLGISRQDNSNVWYRDLHQVFLDAIRRAGAKRVIFASGHDHNLQHFKPSSFLAGAEINYIVSGAGYKQSYARRGSGSEFSYEARGFGKLYFYKDQSVWLEMYAVNKAGEAKRVYLRQIIDPTLSKSKEATIPDSFEALSDSILAAPDASVLSGPFKEVFLGEHYRKLWKLPVKAPLLDMESEKGGLKPVKLGGGMTSNSLRLEAADGREYKLRSIKKDYSRGVSNQYKDFVWVDLAEDETTSALPYGALAVPKLSEALGIYHTDPRLIYLQKQPALGAYNNLIDEGLYLFEERADGKKWGGDANFGNSDKILSHDDVVEKLLSKTNHFVDQKWVLKSRLFDMWVQDWDRHEDQWRWATFEENDQTIYRPIPRDRDWVFFKHEGLIYGTLARFFIRKHKSFEKELKDVIGVNINPANFDRFFMNELTWEEWEEQVTLMQQALTPEVVNAALEDFPPEAVPIIKEEIAEKLNNRIKHMKKYAREYYEALYKEVDIVGTAEKDEIVIEYLPKEQLRITIVRKSKKHGDVTRYDRVFDAAVTKEIHLFALEDKDDIILKGQAHRAIDIHIIGGLGKDELIDQLEGGKPSLILYDEPDGIEYPKLSGLKTKINDDLETNEFDPKDFLYNSTTPILKIGYTFDEGFWFGGGFTHTRFLFRRSPFASQHNFDFSLAPSARFAFKLNYRAEFTNLFGSDLLFAPYLYAHNYNYINFFGLRNELRDDNIDRRFNWVRTSSFGVLPLMKKSWNRNRISTTFGPLYENFELLPQEGRVLEQYDGFTDEDFDRDHFVGLQNTFEAKVIDRPSNPEFGFKFQLLTSYKYRVNDEASTFDLGSNLSFYIPLSTRPRIVLANRLGYHQIFGDAEWYQWPTMGVNTVLRSFRNDRYRGDRILYHQIDLRAKLFTWNNNFFPMSVGVVGGFDCGGVVVNDFNSSDFVVGIATGLYFDLLDAFVIHPFISFYDEDPVFSLTTGFAF